MSPKRVLFVCLGNICRSPMAEAVFLHLIEKQNVKDQWKVDSAAIGSWHIGKQPDSRTRQVLRQNGINYNGRARQIKKADFQDFDFIFGMDNQNIKDLKCLAPTDSKAQILLLGDFDPENERIIRDPYFDSDIKGFEKCYEQCMRCCKAFLSKYT